MVIFVVGEMLWVPTSQAIAAELAPEDLRGAYMGAFNARGPRVRARAVHRLAVARHHRAGRRCGIGVVPLRRRYPSRQRFAGAAAVRGASTAPTRGGRDRVKRLGAIPGPDGTVEFRVWAPARANVALRIGGETHDLARDGGGLRGDAPRGTGRRLPVRPRRRARSCPIPCSRFQPEGIRGPSRVVEIPPAARRGLSLDELVVYELHVGTFSEEGTFDGVIPHLAGLRELGVTAIELMPVADLPGGPRLGLRRRVPVRAAPGVRRPRGPDAASSTPPTARGSA